MTTQRLVLTGLLIVALLAPGAAAYLTQPTALLAAATTLASSDSMLIVEKAGRQIDERTSAYQTEPIPEDAPWSPNQAVSDPVGACAYTVTPSLTVDTYGNQHVLWEDCRSGNSDIYYAFRPHDGQWGANQRVNDDQGASPQRSPAIAVDALGNAYAVWQDERVGNGEIYFSWRDTLGNWSPNVRVSYSTYAAAQPDIAVDSAGNAHVIYRDISSGNAFAANRPAGGSWGARYQVNDVPGSVADNPGIAVDGAGHLYAVWVDRRHQPLDYADIYYSSRGTGGVWAVNERVNDDPLSGGQFQPRIAVDQAGNAFAVWTDLRTDTQGDIYGAYRPAGGNWGNNLWISGEDGDTRQHQPDVALDNIGNTYMVWTDERFDHAGDIFFSFHRLETSSFTMERVNDDGPYGTQWYGSLA